MTEDTAGMGESTTGWRVMPRRVIAGPPGVLAGCVALLLAGPPRPVRGQAATAGSHVREGLVALDDDVSLFYVSVGTGEPIVVLAGGPGLDHTYLRPGLDALATLYRVIYFDPRGAGRSRARLDSTIVSFDAMVDDVDRIRQILGQERITVLAHSFGGLVGLAYARRYADRLRALILVDPVEPGHRWEEVTRRRQAAARTAEDSTELAELIASPGFQRRDSATMNRIYEVSFRSTFRDRSRAAELELHLSSETAHNGPDVARLVGSSLGRIDWWGRLREISAPTLIVHGRFDPIPPAMARALADSIPYAELKLLDTGHFPFVEDSRGFVAAVSAFLSRLER